MRWTPKKKGDRFKVFMIKKVIRPTAHQKNVHKIRNKYIKGRPAINAGNCKFQRRDRKFVYARDEVGEERHFLRSIYLFEPL